MGRRKSKSKNRKPKKDKEIPTAVASSSAPLPPQWIELPGDVTANILQRLGALEILESAEKVCTTWRRVCQDPAMWRVIKMIHPGDGNDEIPYMCRRAVDRSQGQLVDLGIVNFGDDQLLNYIVDRSSDLKRLTFQECYQISGNGLAEAVKKLPHLEELHLIIMPSVEAADIETIGISCSMLKSFSFNDRGCKHPDPEFYLEQDEFPDGPNSNEYALAIAQNMPNLSHLRLFDHWMKNEGLEAILDGCRHLQSLDLRYCFYLDLQGSLGKRCSEQIKDLKCPSDSVTDIDWLPDELSINLYGDQLSDIYSYDSFENYEYYEDFEHYDDYTTPSGIGYFGDVGPWILDHDYMLSWN